MTQQHAKKIYHIGQIELANSFLSASQHQLNCISQQLKLDYSSGPDPQLLLSLQITRNCIVNALREIESAWRPRPVDLLISL